MNLGVSVNILKLSVSVQASVYQLQADSLALCWHSIMQQPLGIGAQDSSGWFSLAFVVAGAVGPASAEQLGWETDGVREHPPHTPPPLAIAAPTPEQTAL